MLLNIALALLQVSTETGRIVIARRDTTFHLASLELTAIHGRASSDGRFYLADQGAEVMYRISGNGAIAEKLISHGEGPGEAKQINIFGWKGDSIGVFDGALRRITLVPVSGGKVRTLQAQDACLGNLPWSMLRDGRCLMAVQGSPMLAAERRPLLILAGGNGFKGIDTIASLSTQHSFISFNFGDNGLTMPQSFSDDPLLAIAPTGDLAAYVDRTVATNQDASFSFKVWTMGSGWSREVVVPYRPLSLSGSSRDSALKRSMSFVTRGNPMSRVTADSVKRRMFTPKYWSPVAAAVMTRDSLIWLLGRQAELEAPKGYRQWMVFDHTGRRIKTVALPSGARLMDSYQGLAWCVVTDEDEVPSVVRFVVGP